MKVYQYVEPDIDGNEITVTMNEDQIMQEYWAYWVDRMIEVGKEDEISRENCISDWIVVNWAWELKDDQ